MPANFSCDAGKLVLLIKTILIHKWKNLPRARKVSHKLGGIIPIYCDGRPLKEGELESHIESSQQIILRVIDALYNGIPNDQVKSSVETTDFVAAINIIIFGKNEGLSRKDWFDAMKKHA